jgi:membrane-associated phospholipid phosphatase
MERSGENGSRLLVVRCASAISWGMRIALPAGSVLVCAALLCARPSRADDGRPEPPPSPFELHPATDATLIVAATAFWLVPSIFQDDFAPGRCVPCDPGEVNALDRTVIGYDDARARAASQVGVVAVPVLAGLGSLLDVRRFGWPGALEDAVLVAESIAVSSALNQGIKNAVLRPRPYMYDADLAAEHGPGRGGFLSFYSNHTALAFSAATSFATIFTLRRPDSPWRFAVWGVAMAGASAVGVCRVLGGVHFWTDVIAGALAGGAIGALVPVLHLRRGRSSIEARAIAGPGGAAVRLDF